MLDAMTRVMPVHLNPSPALILSVGGLAGLVTMGVVAAGVADYPMPTSSKVAATILMGAVGAMAGMIVTYSVSDPQAA
jgi:hypothetical protein